MKRPKFKLNWQPLSHQDVVQRLPRLRRVDTGAIRTFQDHCQKKEKQTRPAKPEVTWHSSFWDTPSPDHHGGANKANPPITVLGELLGRFYDKHWL